MEYKKLNNCYIYDEKNIDYSALTKNFIDEIKKIKKNKVKRNQEKKVSLIELINDIIKEPNV